MSKLCTYDERSLSVSRKQGGDRDRRLARHRRCHGEDVRIGRRSSCVQLSGGEGEGGPTGERMRGGSLLGYAGRFSRSRGFRKAVWRDGPAIWARGYPGGESRYLAARGFAR